jgi:hypothetical protein
VDLLEDDEEEHPESNAKRVKLKAQTAPAALAARPMLPPVDSKKAVMFIKRFKNWGNKKS